MAYSGARSIMASSVDCMNCMKVCMDTDLRKCTICKKSMCQTCCPPKFAEKMKCKQCRKAPSSLQIMQIMPKYQSTPKKKKTKEQEKDEEGQQDLRCSRRRDEIGEKKRKELLEDIKAEEWILKNEDEPVFTKYYINDDIGYGIFTKYPRCEGDFLLNYPGDLITAKEGEKREQQYKEEKRGCYLYYFCVGKEELCIDGTMSQQLGAYVNDAKIEANCTMHKKIFNGRPYLCLYAIKDIDKGVELRYNYGAPNLWWRNQLKHATRKPFLLKDLIGKTTKNDDSTSTMKTNTIAPITHPEPSTTAKKEQATPKTAVTQAKSSVSETAADTTPAVLASNATNDSSRSTTTRISTVGTGNKSSADPEVATAKHEFHNVGHLLQGLQEEQIKKKQTMAMAVDDLGGDIDMGVHDTPIRNDSGINADGSLSIVDATDKEDVDDLDDNLEENDPDYDPLQDVEENDPDYDPLQDESIDEAPCEASLKRTTRKKEDRGERPLQAEPQRTTKPEAQNRNQQEGEREEDVPLPPLPLQSEPQNHRQQEGKEQEEDVAQHRNTTEPQYRHQQQSHNQQEGERRDVNETPKEEAIYVSVVNNKSKRVYKKNNCCYCEKKEDNFGRHLKRRHSDKVDVQVLVSLEKVEGEALELTKEKSEETKKILARLRKLGNYYWNRKVMDQGYGELIPERQPTQPTPHTDYRMCEFCKGFYHKYKLAKHHKICNENKEGVTHGRHTQLRATLHLTTTAGHEMLNPIFERLDTDKIGMICRQDNLIKDLGARLYHSHKEDGIITRYSVVSSNMRAMARIYIAANELNPNIKDACDVINNENYFTVEQAAINLMEKEDAPSIGINLPYVLKRAIPIINNPALVAGNVEVINRCAWFERLLEKNWHSNIARVSNAILRNRKFNRPKLMPMTSDMQKLCKHIAQVMNEAHEALANDNMNIDAWKELEYACLASVILFNRRRSGEASRILMSSFTNRQDDRVDEEILKSLSELEKRLVHFLIRIETQGKRGRTVPVILTPTHVACMELLLKCRGNMRVLPSNKFLFAVSSSNNCIRGWDSIRRYVKQVELQVPQAITGTLLRKQIATLSQILNLEEYELDTLAGFLGHDIRIHREYYRLPENTMQLARCTKILLAMDKGIGDFAGKKLSEIQFDENELAGEEEQEDEDVDELYEEMIEEEVNHSFGNVNETSICQGETAVSKDSRTNEEKKTKSRQKGADGKKKEKRVFSDEATKCIRQCLDFCFKEDRVPNKVECEVAIEDNPCLNGRKWSEIKWKVNTMKTKDKNMLLKRGKKGK